LSQGDQRRQALASQPCRPIGLNESRSKSTH
jgi:hypothetical protein